MKIYDEGSEPLHELIRAASADQGATLLIPDLQRPYVWSPTQVTLLMDSLLRGWPFGTLLLWSVKDVDIASIPSRPFWRVADRTGELVDAPISKSNPPAPFRMVLDGQQRLQSLLLALGGDSWGFRLFDREWSTVLESDRPKGRNAKHHWSLGHLALDLPAFRERVRIAGQLSKIDFRDILSWVVLSPDGGRSALKRPQNYKYPIPSGLESENAGRFLRLSRLWELASTVPGMFERNFREAVEPVLVQHQVAASVRADVLSPLAELIASMVAIKQSKVSYLQLTPFDSEAFGRDAYNDAIVNIFTRLNTAGRALTRQEITFAWIKTGWDASKTGNRTAGACFAELTEALAAEGVSLDIDALVGAVSVMWAILDRNGDLLGSNDLLRGDKVRPMAEDLVRQWQTISTNATDGARLVRERGFVLGEHYRSQNVLTLLLSWRLLGSRWLADHPQNVTVADEFEKKLDSAFRDVCDRWILLSQWSGRWGKSTDKALADYAGDLAADWMSITKKSDPHVVIEVLRARATAWLSGLETDALKYIDDLAVLTRDAVHQYFLPLWLWHRLDGARWNASAVPLRESKRRTLSLEIDHIVAVKLWGSLPGAAKTGMDDGAGADAEQDDVSTTMNALGNCCLLEKTFNINKGAEPLRVFLERVHEFKNGALSIGDWTASLDIDAALVDPNTGKAEDEIRAAVEGRTLRMKTELKAYITGTRDRADV